MKMKLLGTVSGNGCGKVPYPNCFECMAHRGWKTVHSCRLNDGIPHTEREFDGKAKNWCGSCPHPKGCVMCVR